MAAGDETKAARDAARQGSRTVWDRMAAGWYEKRDWISEATSTLSKRMIEMLNPQPGDIVLELAAGVGDSGFMAAPLVGNTGRVISTDFAPQMVNAARQRAAEMGLTNAEFRVLDAERMDIEADSVDGVLCRWAYMLMIDPAAALAETRRVLQPGGRLVFSVFASPERNPWASIVGRVLVTRGHMRPPDPAAPGIFAMANPERIRQLVMGAGFAEPEIEDMGFRLQFPDQESYWYFLTDIAGVISAILKGLSPEDLVAVQQEVREAASPFQAGDGYDFPAVCLNVLTH